MSRTITGSINGSVNLTNASDNPVVVAPNATISGTNGLGIFSNTSTLWTISNYGLVSGYSHFNGNTYGTGIQLANGGIIRNGATDLTAALIQGGWNGLSLAGAYPTGSAGSVVNDGTIVGNVHYGVLTNGGATVVNGASPTKFSDGATAALISGGNTGIAVRANGTNNNGIGHTNYSAAIGTVVNYGTIVGGLTSGGRGIALPGGGSVTNSLPSSLIEGGDAGIKIERTTGHVTNYGTITGARTGISMYDATGTVTNDGTITNQSSASAAVFLQAGGIVANGTNGDLNALISGARGVAISGAPGRVVNNATIAGGVSLGVGGTITNGTTGITLAAITGGINLGTGAGYVTNYGSVAGGITSTVTTNISNGSSVDAAASISGLVNIPNGVLTNFGTIDGGAGDAAHVGAGTLVVTPGAVFVGNVVATNGLLDLPAGTQGTLTGLGSQFTGFAGVRVDAGAEWALASGTTFAGAVSAFGTLLNHANLQGHVTLFGASALYNAADGRIARLTGTMSNTLVNFGSITGTYPSAIDIDIDAPRVLNAATGAVIAGVRDSHTDATVSNYGAIIGPTLSGTTLTTGVVLPAGGSVVNAATASIFAGAGISISGGRGTVVNDGSIGATSAGAVALMSGGVLMNGALDNTDALIAGVNGVTLGAGASTLTNYGSISGGVGVYAAGNATSVTLTNYGTIATTNTAGLAVQLAGGNDTIRMAPGAVFQGGVKGSNSAANVLELMAGDVGTINNFSQAFTAFPRLVVDSGSEWTISGGALNWSSMTIAGTLTDIATSVSAGNVTVSGELINTGNLNNAFTGNVTLQGGTLFNRVRATISSSVYGAISPGTVINNGSIVTNNTTGIRLHAGGSVTNGNSSISGALVFGAQYGVIIDATNGAASLANYGTISGSKYGLLTENGSAHAVNHGTIRGATAVSMAYYDTASTLTNYGVIAASNTSGTAVKFAGSNNLLVIEPGSVFVGKVDGGGAGGNRVVLAAGEGSFIGFGTSFVNFGTIQIDPNAVWNFGTHATIGSSAHLINNGTITTGSSSSLRISQSIQTSSFQFGLISIGNGSSADLLGPVDDGQTIDFSDGAGDLGIGDPGNFDATLQDFGTDDSFDLGGLDGDFVALVGKNINVSNHGTLLKSLPVSGTTAPYFKVSSTGTGTHVTGSAVSCFAAGTRIMTERGEVAVEDLRPRDRALVSGPASGARPVIWIGRRHVDCAQHSNPRHVWPVLVRAGAFGPGRPHRDLYLSPDHAIFACDVLIPVKHLIDGRTIAQIHAASVTYYHVELPQHSVLLAEGLQVESYLDSGDRANFANGGGPIRLFPEFSQRLWEAHACAPLEVIGPVVAKLRRQLSQNRLYDPGSISQARVPSCMRM